MLQTVNSFALNLPKFPGGKIQLSLRNFMNILKIKRKIHGIFTRVDSSFNFSK